MKQALAFALLLCTAAVAREPRWPRPIPQPAPSTPAQAATAAANGPACSKQAPFYWELGNASGKLAAGTVGGTTYTAEKAIPIASASKFYYSAYVAEVRNGVYTDSDRKFLNFRSGYGALASCRSTDTVGSCAARAPYASSSDGLFDYGGGHMQKHASLKLATMNAAQLSAEVNRTLGTAVKFTTPQPAGGITTSPSETAAFLRSIISGRLELSKHLGESQVPTKGPLAVSSPVPEPWTYSLGHWVELDGTFTGAGAFGDYFWISADKKLYGVVARKTTGGAWASVTCGRAIRVAYVGGQVKLLSAALLSLASIAAKGAPPATFSTGYDTDRVRPTKELPANSTSGAFRVQCDIKGISFDDPIAKPGIPAGSHAHSFHGNTGTDYRSTPGSIATTGNSTCRGGTVNRTSYWYPTVIETVTNTPVLPESFLAYYKSGLYSSTISADRFTPAVVFQAFPTGFRILAGDAMAKTPPTNTNDLVTRFNCLGQTDRKFGPSIPDCNVGSKLVQEVFFPQCWDGVNLDSPNHKSHMHYGVLVKNAGDSRGWFHRECPVTHPVVMPQIAYEVTYPPVTYVGQTTKWRLSSDAYVGPAGYSAHGDWFNGWKADIMKAFVDNLINANKDGHAHLLGDGREIY